MKLKCFIDSSVKEIIASYFSHVDLPRSVFEERSGLICRGTFSEAYLLNQEVLEVTGKLTASGRIPYSAGLHVGRISSNRLIPSHDFLQFIYDLLGKPVKAIEVSEAGLKPFLYGKDVLKASTVKCYPPLKRGDFIGVIGTDRYVYGIGKSLINACDELIPLRNTEPVAINVFDVGWYLRGGTEPKERKLKNLKP